MPYPHAFSVSLVQRGAPAAQEQALWLADTDVGVLAQLQQRRDRIEKACTDALPGWEPCQLALHDLADILEPDDPVGPRMPALALARYQRYLQLSCGRPYGRIGLQVFDTVVLLDITLDDPSQWQRVRPALQQDLEALLAALAHADGLHVHRALGGPTGTDSPKAQAISVLDQQAPHIAKHARKARTMAWQAALGLPSVVLTGLLAAALALWLLWDADRLGSLVRLTDASRPLPFISQRLEERFAGWGLLPRFVLHGHVQSDDASRMVLPASVRVHRDVALRTGPGARYTVLSTRDPDQPYVLRNDHDDVGPVLPVGERGLHWSAALALPPLALWYGLVLRPWRAAARADAGVRTLLLHRLVRSWGGMLVWCTVLATIVGWRRWFG